eukprot:1196326-Prorocentrum_minimum.AAC.14
MAAASPPPPAPIGRHLAPSGPPTRTLSQSGQTDKQRHQCAAAVSATPEKQHCHFKWIGAFKWW